MELLNISAQQLRRAADIQERIQSLQAELSGLLGAPEQPANIPTTTGGKRKISAAGIERIRAAQKARWAKAKAAVQTAQPRKKARRRMSPAAKARLSAIAKARWAKAKKQGKTAL